MIKSGLAAPRNFDPVYVWLGSRLCENAHERLSDTPESQANFGSVWPPKPEVCGLATPASLIARRCPRLIKPRQIRALRLSGPQRGPYFTGLMAILSRAWPNPSFIS